APWAGMRSVKGQAPYNRSPFAAYTVAVVATVLALGARYVMSRWVGSQLPHVTFYLSVSVAAWYGGVGPALVALLLGVVAADYFFVPPFHSLNIYQTADAVDVILFFCVGLTIALLSEMLHNERRRVQETSNALLRSNQAAADILGSITDAHYIVDCDWKLVEVNPRAAAHLGLDRDAVL